MSFAVIASAVERFDQAKLSQMGDVINQAVSDHQLPGGVLWLESRGSNYHHAFGHRTLEPKPEPMTEDTIFDVASMTKILATTPALMLLFERGKVSLDEPIGSYLSEFKRNGETPVTIRHLMSHTSGFERTLRRLPDWGNLAQALTIAAAEPPPHRPGTVLQYSDINFIILGELVQRITGTKLNEFAAKEIYEPLKMIDTGYLPAGARLSRIAPTNQRNYESQRGKVHDPKALRMGGVAGHAGVFTTASDLARFARMILNEGELDGVRIFKPETVRLMTSVQTPPSLKGRRGLGWDIDSDFSRPRGQWFPLGSFGHTGFTGTCIWIDPYSKSFWMFLSNRVLTNPSGNIYAVQRALADLSAGAIQDFNFRDVPNALPPQKEEPTPEPASR
jgi:CubicO group peptidase (beta-lactamase class C family)